MAVNEYVAGTPVEVEVAFTNVAKEPADPTVVTLQVKKPDGSTVSFTGADLSNDSTGVYSTTFVADQVGDWHYRWTGTGALVAATEGVFTCWSDFA